MRAALFECLVGLFELHSVDFLDTCCCHAEHLVFHSCARESSVPFDIEEKHNVVPEHRLIRASTGNKDLRDQGST